MISLTRLFQPRAQNRRRVRLLPRRAKVLWTIGNTLMLLALVLLLYVGGLEAQAEYAHYAARGDTDVPAPVAVSASLSDEPALYQPAPFTAPVLNGSVADGLVVGVIPDAGQAAHQGSVGRVIIPRACYAL